MYFHGRGSVKLLKYCRTLFELKPLVLCLVNSNTHSWSIFADFWQEHAYMIKSQFSLVLPTHFQRCALTLGSLLTCIFWRCVCGRGHDFCLRFLIFGHFLIQFNLHSVFSSSSARNFWLGCRSANSKLDRLFDLDRAFWHLIHQTLSYCSKARKTQSKVTRLQGI